MVDLSKLEQESIYIPFSGLDHEKQAAKQGDKAYAAYTSLMYRKHKVWIQPFMDLDLSTNQHPVYFHTSHYMPYFRNKGYNIETVFGIELLEHLRQVTEETYVVISVKDDGSQQITGSTQAQLNELGIKMINNSHLRHSYIWVAKKTGNENYEVIYENCSTEDLIWEGELGGIELTVKSGGAVASNISSIMYGNKEQSLNQRGFNMFTFNSEDRTSTKTISFDTFATLYAQGSLFKAVPECNKDSYDPFSLIGRAGGRIDGVDYTNCQEALDESYYSRGHRVFEIDFELTLDDELVARYSWEPFVYDLLKQNPPEGIEDGAALTREQFLNLKILNKYTPLTISDLFKFMADHPDAYVVTDTRYTDPERINKQFIRMVECAAPYGYHLLFRVIPQIYTEEMYQCIEKIFPFPRYVYTLYKTQATDQEVCEFVKENQLAFVALYPERFNLEFITKLGQSGADLLIHTINDIQDIQSYLRSGVKGFYTDQITASEIDKEKYGAQIEMKLRESIISQLLEAHFFLSEDEIIAVIEGLEYAEMIEITQQLFEPDTFEYVLSFLKRVLGNHITPVEKSINQALT
jgi:glycerophosphoryl diester phosphodiesterase